MRLRPLVLCAVLLGAVLGAAGCSSSGTSAPGGSSGGKAPVGKPTGTVTVRSGGKVVCVITLDKNGTGTCKVSTAGDAPGKVTYTGAYNGSSGFTSGSGATTVTILPAKPAGPTTS
jgi:hypothetical protein